MTEEERVTLSFEDAIQLLPEGDRIHTFRNPAGILIGADWDREDILKHIQDNEVELSGGMAANMNHGLVLLDNQGYLFIETKEEETNDQE